MLCKPQVKASCISFCSCSVECISLASKALAGANGLASLVLQCLWESFALPVIVEPLVTAVGSSQQGPQLQQVKGGCGCNLSKSKVCWATGRSKYLQSLLTARGA